MNFLGQQTNLNEYYATMETTSRAEHAAYNGVVQICAAPTPISTDFIGLNLLSTVTLGDAKIKADSSADIASYYLLLDSTERAMGNVSRG